MTQRDDDHSVINIGQWSPIPAFHRMMERDVVGKTAGRFILRRLIGAGGQAGVYEGRCDQTGQRAAVKLVITEDERFISRFEQEAELLAALEHVNIVKYYDHGTTTIVQHKWFYLAMEHFDGLAITKVANDLSDEAVVDFLIAATDAVAHMHSKPVIHRDLTGDNILVDEKGYLKVIDFGIAKRADLIGRQITQQAESLFTPGYASPEQRTGKAVSTATDVYALGAVAYHALTGIHPPDDLDSGTIWTHRGNGNRRIDRDLEAIIRQAMQPESGDRYETAAALAADLRRFRNGEPIRARHTPAWERIRKAFKRRPAYVLIFAGATGVLLFLLIVGASLPIAGWLVQRELEHQLREPAEVRLTANGADLRSHAGAILHPWRGSVAQAEYVIDQSQAFLVFSSDEQKFQPGLSVFDVNADRGKPIWRAVVDETAKLPAHPLRRLVPADLVANHFFLEDVFPQFPGPEVIVILQHTTFSACCLQIRDLEGKVLFECFHEGNIVNVFWMPNAGLLVLSAWNGEKTWVERGILGLKHAHPCVVFAIRPEVGLRDYEWLNPDFGGQAAVMAEWYYYVAPPVVCDLMRKYELRAATGRFADGQHVSFVVYSHESEQSWIGYTISASGEVVESVPSDAMKREQELLDLGIHLSIDALGESDRP